MLEGPQDHPEQAVLDPGLLHELLEDLRLGETGGGGLDHPRELPKGALKRLKIHPVKTSPACDVKDDE